MIICRSSKCLTQKKIRSIHELHCALCTKYLRHKYNRYNKCVKDEAFIEKVRIAMDKTVKIDDYVCFSCCAKISKILSLRRKQELEKTKSNDPEPSKSATPPYDPQPSILAATSNDQQPSASSDQQPSTGLISFTPIHDFYSESDSSPSIQSEPKKIRSIRELHCALCKKQLQDNRYKKCVKDEAYIEKVRIAMDKTVNFNDYVCFLCYNKIFRLYRRRKQELEKTKSNYPEPLTSISTTTSGDQHPSTSSDQQPEFISFTPANDFYSESDSSSSSIQSDSSDETFICEEEESKQNENLIQVPNARCMATHSYCFICRSKTNLKRVPFDARQQVFKQRKLIIPKTNRCCSHHLIDKLLHQTDIDKIEIQESSTSINNEDYFELLHGPNVINKEPEKTSKPKKPRKPKKVNNHTERKQKQEDILIEVPYARCSKSSGYCFICLSKTNLRGVPLQARIQVFAQRQLIIPNKNRCCFHHLSNDLFYQSEVDRIEIHQLSTLISEKDYLKLVNGWNVQ